MQWKYMAFATSAFAAFGAANPVSAQQADTYESAPELAANPAAIARLIEVWGFVKYHHPHALDGRLAMDPEFFALYPQIRAASSLEKADRVLTDWIERIGTGPACDPCASEPDPAQVAIASTTPVWLAGLPPELSEGLQAIYANRGAAQANFQIAKDPGVGNPAFANEPDYTHSGRTGEEAVHLLALARQWNLLRYWFPYRDVMDRQPAALLPEAVSDFLAAQTDIERQQARLRFAAAADDGHVNIMAYREAGTPPGECASPYGWQFVEGRLALDGRAAEGADALQRGDVVTAIDGVSLDELADRYGSMIAASNTSWRERMLAMVLARGACGERQIAVERGGASMTVAIEWLPASETKISPYPAFGREGEVIQQIDDITYVRFADLKRDQLPDLLEAANAGDGLILDMRGYVSDFLVFELGKLLVDEPTEFVTFTAADVSAPGRFLWGARPVLQPDPQGRSISVPVVAIVNAATVSSPEYHAMAWRAAGVTIVGSTTAGADGNVSTLPLPDGAGMRFSGIGVYYPDQSPTQRIGIVPDVMAAPTLAGLAAGRDEQLELAVEQIARERAAMGEGG